MTVDNFTVNSGVLSAEQYDAAEHLLQDFSGDYAYFAISDSSSCLVMGAWDQTYFINCEVFIFDSTAHGITINHHTADVCTVDNSANHYLMYSSVDAVQTYPKFGERGDLYAKTLVLCCCVGFGFVLVLRIFRHIS